MRAEVAEALKVSRVVLALNQLKGVCRQHPEMLARGRAAGPPPGVLTGKHTAADPTRDEALMPVHRTAVSVVGKPPAHPLARPRPSAVAVIVVIGWLALLGWSPEQSLALLLIMFPAVAASVAGGLG